MDHYGESQFPSDDLKPSDLPSDWFSDSTSPSTFSEMQSVQHVPAFDDYWNNQSSSHSPGPVAVRSQPFMNDRAAVSSPYASPLSVMSGSTVSVSSAPSRRGRPMKAASDSKMAVYARNYRESKKNQTSVLEQQNKELTDENLQLRQQCCTLQESLSRVEREIQNLRRVLDQDSNIASLVARMSGRQGGSPSTSDVGVCLHLAGGKMTLEVCEQCSSNSRSRTEHQDEKPLPINTPLFNGDFDKCCEVVAHCRWGSASA